MRVPSLLKVFVCGDGKLLYWNRFVNKVSAASRAGVACLLVAGVTQYVPVKSLVSRLVAFPTFAPVIAISACDPTLGKVLHNVAAIMEVSVFVMCSTMLIFRFLRPPIDLAVAVACVGICSFAVMYPTHITLMGKKVGLAQISMTFVSAHLDPELDIVYMPLKFLSSIFVGVTAAVIALLVPAPRLAVCQVQRSADSVARCASELFKTVTTGFSVTDASNLYSISLYATVLRKSAAEFLKELQDNQADLWWEWNACCSRSGFTHMTNGLNKLNLHLAGMELALRSGHILHSPEALRASLKEPILNLVEMANLLAKNAVKEQVVSCTRRLRSPGQSKVIEEGKEALFRFDEAFLSARKMTYYGTADAAATIAPIIRSGPTIASSEAPSSGLNFMARVAAYFFLFNMRLYMKQIMELVNPEDMAARNRVLGSQKWIPGLELRMGTEDLNIAALPAFPSSHHDAIQGRSCPIHGLQSLGEISPGKQGIMQAGSTHTEVLAHDYQGLRVVRESQGNHLRPCNRCVSVRAKQQEESGLALQLWKTLKSVVIPDPIQSKVCCRISLALMLATILGAVDLKNDSHSSWAPVTVSFIVGYHQGGTFRMALLRIQGTVLGSIYGYLTIRGTANYGYLTIIALTLWVMLSDIVRQSKTYGYAGLVSSVTAAGMMLGDYPDEAKKYALDRITQTFIGVLCFVFVETVLWPDQAASIVRKELVNNLIDLRGCIANIVTVYNEAGCPICRCRAVEDIEKLEKKLKANLSKQVALQGEAVLEPDLWFVPFPGDIYAKLIAIQGRMLDLLFFMVCSLQATTENDSDDHIQQLLKPLQMSLTSLQDELSCTLIFLQDLLQAPASKHAGRVCGRCTGSSDIETSQTISNLYEKSETAPHPIQILDERRRTAGGTPLMVRSTIDRLAQTFEEAFEEIITESRRLGGRIVSSSVMLSISSLSFCLHSLLKETVELEKSIYELLQAEKPWSIMDFLDAYAPSKLWDNPEQRVEGQSW